MNLDILKTKFQLTKKEITLRLLRVSLAIIFSIILFPYFEDFITKYSSELVLFFLFSSFVVLSISIIAALIIGIVKKLLFKKKETENNSFQNIFYVFRLLLVTIFALYSLTQIQIYWTGLILIFIEFIGVLSNNEFKKIK